MASQQGGKQKVFIIGGLITVVGVVGYLASSYPPDSADTSGTIAPVKRYSADKGQSATIAGGDQSMLDARCESCGQCVAYCPVGTLYDKMSLKNARANMVHKVRTTCPYCGVRCNFDLNVCDGRIVRVTSASDAPGTAVPWPGR